MPSDHIPPPPGYAAQPAVPSYQAAGPSGEPAYGPLSGTRPARAGLDRGTKRLVAAACGLGAVLAALVGGWAVMSGRHRPVPVFEADGRPLRVKPENPGGMQMPGLDEPDGKAAMAPKTEAPSPQALRAQLPAPRPAAPPDPAPAAAAPTAPPPPAMAPPAPPQLAPPRPAAPATPSTAPASVAPAAAAAAAPVSAALVQLAAVASEQAAQAEWQRLAKRMPELLGGRKPTLQRVERDGRVIWRVRTGGFADLAEAASFCGRVRAKGVSCSIAAF